MNIEKSLVSTIQTFFIGSITCSGSYIRIMCRPLKRGEATYSISLLPLSKAIKTNIEKTAHIVGQLMCSSTSGLCLQNLFIFIIFRSSFS